MTPEARTALINRIAQHEGLRLKPYVDSVGKISIGYGRNLEDKGISKREAAFFLNNDVDEAETAAMRSFPWMQALTEARQGVLVEMVFNMGARRVQGFGQTLKALQEGRYGDAADQMLKSRWAQQVGQRAVTLAGIMRAG